MVETKPVLEVKNVCKAFKDLVALDHVDFSIREGEIHGLLGENGAGKTTLMNIIYGLYKADEGEIHMNGQKVIMASPRDAIEHKIGMIHQHFTLVPAFTVLENMILGMRREGAPLSLGLKEEGDEILKLSEKFGLEIPLNAKVRDLPVGVQQRVEISRALYRGAKILILDEPTANLVPHEVDKLFASLGTMVREGLTVVFITHKIREAMAVCSRITILKNGRVRGTLNVGDATPEKLVAMMVGTEIDVSKSILLGKSAQEISLAHRSERPTLIVRSLRVVREGTPAVEDCSFEVHGGEILGIAGVSGNGQKELVDAIIGLREAEKGDIIINGKDTRNLSTFQILSTGVVYIPEDRIREGVLPLVTVAENLILGRHRQDPFCESKFVLNWKKISDVSKELISTYNIKTMDERALAITLSGGNIQRLMLARAFSQPASLLIAHNPTRGLDIASTDFVLKKLMEYRNKGAAILWISEDLDELLLLSDRICVIYRGEMVGMLERKNFDKHRIGLAMTGVERIENH